MELKTEVHQIDFPRLFSIFDENIDSRCWRKLVAKINAEIRGNKFLKEHLEKKNELIFSLQKIDDFRKKNGHLNFKIEQSNALYEACTLISQFSLIQEQLNKAQVKALAGRVRGGFQNPNDLRALIFELQMATHFAKRGYSIVFPESDGDSIFDVHAANQNHEIEIECKSISEDKGRQIHKREALEIFNLIKKDLEKLTKNLNEGLLIRIFFEGRAPKNYNQRIELSKSIKLCVLNDGHRADKFRIETRRFDIEKPLFSAAGIENNRTNDLLKKFGILNRESLVYACSGGGLVILTLESDVADKPVEEIFESASDAAKNQLTGNHMGIVCIKLESLTGAHIRDIGQETGNPTALRVAASKFISSSSAKNATAVVFFADDELSRNEDGSFARSTTSYGFVNEKNPFSKEFRRSNFFSE